MGELKKQESDWSSLDRAKFAVSVATPVVVVVVGWLINRRLKFIDQAQWQNRKIIEKRIALYDDIAPLMNRVYCFCRWVGYWKDITPDEVLEAKRELDKTINIYRHLLSEGFYSDYNKFIHISFRTWTGRGEDAKIKSQISGGNGNRRKDCNYKWHTKWDSYFNEESAEPFKKLDEVYAQAMAALKLSIGLDERTP